jgi:uncharacterized protein YwqG
MGVIMIKYQVSDLFKEYEGIIKTTIRKSNEISFISQSTKPWESKLGGCPYLEDIKDYPLDGEGNPMMFLAQINLSDLMELDNMPQNGLLQFYICNDDCYGLDKKCVVRYIEDYFTDLSRLILKNPYEEDYKEFLPFQREGKMCFETREMPIPSSCEGFYDLFQGITFSKEQEDKSWDEFDSSGSRVGGYPYFIQGDSVCYSEYDILLLQLDTENECGIMFGDSGNCNFFIKEEDLRNKDFSNVQYDWQCC